MSANQFKLLARKRFAPFFWTQFLGAFNDNIFKNSLMILISFKSISLMGFTPSMLINIAGVLFILPYFLFSATAGQLADKYEKAKLIRYVKLLEIVIMLFSAIGFYFDNISVLLFVLFLLGMQSTFFGPVKYSILPQHLKTEELLGGNGLVEMGTFVAILLGTVLGGILIAIPHTGVIITVIITLLVALLGFTMSCFIPKATSTDPSLKISYNIFRETWRNIQYSRHNRTVFNSMMGISWFWFFGTIILYQVPEYTHHILHGDEHVATIILVAFSVGIGIGSLLCEKLSGGTIEIGLVPLGAVGLTIFTINLWHKSLIITQPHHVLNAIQFLTDGDYWRIIVILILIGISGGLFTVPLYTLIQHRSKPKHLSRIIAANNIFNAIFMVIAGIYTVILLKVHATIPQIFLVLGILNLIVCIFIFTLLPEFIMRLIVWIIVNTLYSVKQEGLDNIPEQGPAILVCNHISYVDALVIGACSRRPVRFVMDYHMFKVPVMKFIFKNSGAIPIAGAKHNPQIKEKAFELIHQGLTQNDLICIFPEGKLTTDGEIDEFRKGIDRIITETPVTVIPMALCGLWGTYFSHKDRPALQKIPRKFRAKVALRVGQAIPAEQSNAELLQEKVKQLRGEWQ